MPSFFIFMEPWEMYLKWLLSYEGNTLLNKMWIINNNGKKIVLAETQLFHYTWHLLSGMMSGAFNDS